MERLSRILPLQRISHEPVWWLTMAGVAIAALVDALSVPGTTWVQAAVLAASALAARARVTPTAKLAALP